MAKDEERMAVAEIKIENIELAIAHKEKAFLEKYKEEYNLLLKNVEALREEQKKSSVENAELRAKIKDLEAAIKTLAENVNLLTKVYTEYEKKFSEKKAFLKGAVWAWSIPLAFIFTLIAEKIRIIANWLFS